MEEERLLLNYKDIRSHLIRFGKHTNNIAELFDEIKPYIEELYEISAGDEDSLRAIWEFGGINNISKEAEKIGQKTGFKKPDRLYSGWFVLLFVGMLIITLATGKYLHL